MNVLTEPQGPFKGCSASKGHDHQRSRSLAVDAVPTKLFEPDD
ncbi:hypothetical protein ACHAAC_16155 [Aeromicrobium sp. CF4.19]